VDISSPLSRFFDLERRGTTVATELRGAAATILTMSYILVANPTILAAAGVPFEELIIPDDTHHWLRHANAVRVDAATADFFDRKLGTARTASRDGK
jgi:hypothetical protein